MTIEIPLTQNKVAIIDDEDYLVIKDYKWYGFWDGFNWYATTFLPNGKFTNMHRLILNAPPNMEVDHRDGNGLNNTRQNIRLCTHQQNTCNVRRPSSNTSGYKGVKQHKKSGHWIAAIRGDGMARHIGMYHTALEAAIAYNHAAKLYHGEFANFNEIPDWESINPERIVPPVAERKSVYRGVLWERAAQSWRARIAAPDGERIYLGNFKEEEAAAIAYNHAAKELFGEEAEYNSIPGWEKIDIGVKIFSIANRDNKSGYRGVTARNGRWRATISIKGKQKNIGWYDNPEEAAAAYDRLAAETFGDKAKLNFPK